MPLTTLCPPLSKPQVRAGIPVRAALLLVAVLLAVVEPARAQNQRPDRWQAVMENGDIAWDFRLVALKEDRLTIRQADSTRDLKVGDITELRLIQPSEMQIGAGNMAGATNALTGADDLVFDMRPLDFAERLRVVQQVMLKYPPRQ